MKSFRIIIAIVFAFLYVTSVHAQSPPAYTLEQCIETGLKNNIDILRARNNIDRSGSFRTEAYGQFLPSLRASASWSRSDAEQLAFRADNLLRSRNSYSYSVQAGLTLFDGMRNFNTVDQSLLEFNAAEESFQRTRQYVVYAIQQSFLNTLRMEQLEEVAESNLERGTAQLERIREMYAVGAVPRADVLRQEVVLGNDELAVIEAHNNYINALVDLQAMIGLSPRPAFEISAADIPESILDTDITRFRAGLGEFDALLDEAVNRRADYRQADLSLQSAEKGVSIARAGHVPSVSAFAQYNWN
ncbi:MAG: TolC family protein, partial [Bacteroidetes bacterium]|nr:TolC family protein [Bacteroidota bacterium]